MGGGDAQQIQLIDEEFIAGKYRGYRSEIRGTFPKAGHENKTHTLLIFNG
ncbi:hypothetical protein GCM10027185_54530 [Spirosoma pulveris]